MVKQISGVERTTRRLPFQFKEQLGQNANLYYRTELTNKQEQVGGSEIRNVPNPIKQSLFHQPKTPHSVPKTIIQQADDLFNKLTRIKKLSKGNWTSENNTF